MSSPNSPRAAASAAPAPGLQADDLRRQNTTDDDDQDRVGSERPTTAPPTGDERHARGYPRRPRQESDTSSKKSSRSAWRKYDRKKNEKEKETLSLIHI